MKHYLLFYTMPFAVALTLGSCTKTESLTARVPNTAATPSNYSVQGGNSATTPIKNYLKSDATGNVQFKTTGNPTSNADPTLGRVLFYENQFTANNDMNCGSCHRQHLVHLTRPTDVNSSGSNTTTITGTSQAYNGAVGNEGVLFNPLQLEKLAYNKKHANAGLEQIDNLVMKLKGTAYYAPLFTAAYGTPEITADRVADALTKFIRSMENAESTLGSSAVITSPKFADPFN